MLLLQDNKKNVSQPFCRLVNKLSSPLLEETGLRRSHGAFGARWPAERVCARVCGVRSRESLGCKTLCGPPSLRFIRIKIITATAAAAAISPPSLPALFSQIYSRAARSRLTQTFCRQRRDVTYARSLLRSERFPPPVFKDNLVPSRSGNHELPPFELIERFKD